jgi:hypothetical protein
MVEPRLILGHITSPSFHGQIWSQHGNTPNLDIPQQLKAFGCQSFNKLCKLQKLLKAMNGKKKKKHIATLI